ncbi:MAG: O-antigen ligase family protein [Bacteroidota bacterium]
MPITTLLWVIRWTMGVLFLVVSLRAQQVSLGDAVGMFATLLPTFFYEVGFCARKMGHLEFVLGGLVVVAVLTSLPVAIAALWYWVRDGMVGFLYATNSLRKINTFWPNHVAMLMAVSFAIAQELAHRDRRYLLLSAAALMIVGISHSRTGVTMLLTALLVGRFLLRGKNRRRAVILVTVVAMVAGAAFVGKSALSSSSVLYSMIGRMSRWEAALPAVFAHPITGTGFRSFAEAVPQYLDRNTGTYGEVGSAHNDYIDLMVRGGLPYTALFLLIVGFQLLFGVELVLHRPDWADRLSLTVLALLLAAMLVQQPLKSVILAPLFWFFLGVSACSNVPGSTSSSRADSPQLL